LRDLQANSPWQKLRSSPLMWLQLAVVALCVLALSRPAITMLAGGGQTLAIVLDGSASMGATDVSPSRFELARAEARRLIAGWKRRSGHHHSGRARTRVLSPLSSDKSALNRAVSRASIEDARSICARLCRWPLRSCGARRRRRYRGFGWRHNSNRRAASGGRGRAVGTRRARGDNLAITALDVARSYSAGARPQLFSSIANFGARERASTWS
jgi:hypothetical protein